MAKKKIFYGSPNKIMDFMGTSKVSATFYSIANTLFMLEKLIKSGEKRKSVKIDYYVDLSEEEIKELSNELKNLVLDVLCEEIDFKFVKSNLNINVKNVPNFGKNDTICLYSGGIDSTLGILKSKEKYGNVIGLYVGHQDLGKITHKIEIIKKELLDSAGISLIKFLAPAMGKGYSQLRGFLYVLYGAVLADFLEAKRIIIAECGVTMYQPKFAPMDTITYTTHPLVLRTSKKITEIILKRPLALILPFEDFTKTEMMKLLSDDNILSKTHSCLSARWNQNCGGCYACITRMIGSVNLELSTSYFKDSHFGDRNNEILSSLINFCFNFEINKKEVDYWSLKTIETFDKSNLFRRHCLDVFLSLNKLSKKGLLDSDYGSVLDSYKKVKGEEELINREKQLNDDKKHPDFDKEVRL
ncbi:MAG: 7-cyano-7-deazaguanine synthase [Nanoarchaeota archaeon]